MNVLNVRIYIRIAINNQVYTFAEILTHNFIPTPSEFVPIKFTRLAKNIWSWDSPPTRLSDFRF